MANWNKGKQEEFRDRRSYDVGKAALLLFALLALALATGGCGSTAGKMTDSASGKNLNLDGYVMLGELETANPETATPQGKLIIGRVTYRSRKVGIPADQKVPTTGYFKATKTKSLFGTEEAIIEYDFTAGSDADAKRAEDALEAKRKEAVTANADSNDEACTVNDPGAAADRHTTGGR